MSECQKGNKKRLGDKASPEEIAKRVAKLIGQKRTPEQKERMRLAHLGEKHSLQRRINTSNARKGIGAKKIINTETGEIFNSCAEAAEKTGTKKTTLTARLNGQNKNSTTLKYL